MEEITKPLPYLHYDVEEWKRQQRQRGRPPWETAPFPQVPPEPTPPRLRIVALIPAYNEEEGIGGTIDSFLAQTRPLDEIIVIADNCTDRTVEVASGYPAPVRVVETEGNEYRKSGGLNFGWHKYCKDAEIIVSADGDTELVPTAVADWEAEFLANPKLGGSSSQPIMTGSDYLSRLQRYEFEKATTLTLSRGRCRVVAGTGCAYRNEALREVARLPERPGPWAYDSVVEDYELTYRMRALGWDAVMSPTVICYTGAMKTLKSLWAQRIKWEGGTNRDLLRFGVTRLNWREWMSRGFLLLNISFWVVWLALNGTEFIVGHGQVNWWWQLMSAFLVFTEYISVRQMRGHRWARDWKDTALAVCLVHMVTYNVLAIAWGSVSWWKVLTGQLGDPWASQYRAEGMQQVEDMKVGVES